MTNFKFVAGDLCMFDTVDLPNFCGLVEIIRLSFVDGEFKVYFQVLNGGVRHGKEYDTMYYVKNFKELLH